MLNYPPLLPSDSPDGSHPRVNVQIRAPEATTNGTAETNGNKKALTTAEALAKRRQINGGQGVPGQPVRPEDKPDTPEYKKKQAMLKGPILELAQEHPDAYGMKECSFTGLRDIFTALVESNVRTGVLSPQRFLEVFKKENEMFRNPQHQDAHEFYGLVLNDVIATVGNSAKKLLAQEADHRLDSITDSLKSAFGDVARPALNGMNSPGTGWVHNIFEGVLVSETKCLTCETASQRDETFLDLSIDLEEHSSVTACLQKFSAEEMLCERNKFHCDHCGGLQEAEKRMKIKRLPKVLALHLKRFKYTEDYSRLQKLFHRVIYPYHLRMFNTTNDAEDPDRLYELYAVVVHIGGNAYHGHYVSVIKTEDRGWLLFDDEMVEPVDKHYVRNFFGDKPGMACAYVLFYQETTFEKARAEQEAEGLEEVRIASEKADVTHENGQVNGTPSPVLTRQVTQPNLLEHHEGLSTLDHAASAPGEVTGPEIPSLPVRPNQVGRSASVTLTPLVPTRAETRPKDKREARAQEKARKLAEKEELKAKEKERKENGTRLRDARKSEQDALKRVLEESRKTFEEEDARRKDGVEDVPAQNPGDWSPPPLPPLPPRPHPGPPPARGTRRSMSRRSFGFLNKDRLRRDSADNIPPAPPAPPVTTMMTTMTTTTATTLTSQNVVTTQNGGEGHARRPSEPFEPTKPKRSFTFGLGRKRSNIHP